MRTRVFAALALSGAMAVATPPAQAAAPDASDVTIQRVGFGGHRHGKSEDSTSTKKPEAPHPPPPPETAAQHKAYLNRYGFGR